MTDLEITGLCAEAMGLNASLKPVRGGVWHAVILEGSVERPYSPLYDDAQAMALVKRFGLQLSARGDAEPEKWLVAFGFNRISNYVGHHTESDDLNRAICECVAKTANNALISRLKARK